MIDCIMGITNTGTFERGRISPREWFTIDRVVLKFRSGKRRVRYAVCVNGHWKTNQTLTLREAREEVARLQEESKAAEYYAMYI